MGDGISTSFVVMCVIVFLFILNVFMAAVMVFFERRNPASTWAWLLVLFFIPVIGFLIYMFFGRESKRERMFSEKELEDRALFLDFLNMQPRYKYMFLNQQRKSTRTLTGYKYLDDLARLNVNVGSLLTSNNHVDYFINGKDKFESLIKDIRSAKSFIHMEYYIIRNDKLSSVIIDELAKKAEKGVEVRLLFDGMGCRTLSKRFFRKLRKAGGNIAAFVPPIISRINYRDHRKIAVIDGQIGYIGGFNIGDEYLGIVKRYGNWRDTHLRIYGDAVDFLQLRFILDWNFVFPKGKLLFTDKYFPERETFARSNVQIVSSGPDTQWKSIRNAYFKMISEAEDHIYISTPYFVPDDSVFVGLKVAALAGIDVRIIIPAHPDHFFVYWASMSYLGELLEAGVRCYQYEKGFIHTKTIFVDSIISSIGTANMDVRSFDLNFECNAFIYDELITKSMETDFLNDLKDCTEITRDWYYSRNARFKIKEAVSRLISPML